MGHHKSGVDHFIGLGWNAETCQFGGIIFPGLDGFIGKKDNLPAFLPKKSDYPIRSWDEFFTSIDCSI
jgi:hypothetical protein